MQTLTTAAPIEHWVDTITWVFLIANTGRLLAYIPQFISAWKCQYGAKSVSILTWSYFMFAHCTAFVYALLVLKDSKSVWIFAGNLVVTMGLVALLLWKRLTYVQALRPAYVSLFPSGKGALNDDRFDNSLAVASAR